MDIQEHIERQRRHWIENRFIKRQLRRQHSSMIKNLKKSSEGLLFHGLSDYILDLPRLKELLKSGTYFLDLGCGYGNALLDAADLVGNTGVVVGIDAVEKFIKNASRTIKDSERYKQGEYALAVFFKTKITRELIARVKIQNPRKKCIILSSFKVSEMADFSDPNLFDVIVAYQARLYMSYKIEEFLQAIKALKVGGRYFDTEATGTLQNNIVMIKDGGGIGVDGMELVQKECTRDSDSWGFSMMNYLLGRFASEVEQVDLIKFVENYLTGIAVHNAKREAAREFMKLRNFRGRKKLPNILFYIFNSNTGWCYTIYESP